jgi:hypothetical protein
MKFLGKEVSDEAFPNTNNPVAYKGRIDRLIKSVLVSAVMNITIVGVLVYGVAFYAVPRYHESNFSFLSAVWG